MGTILETSELTKQLASHRAGGARLVLANGCFDLLHVGHVRYLKAAAAEGDILVVAVNSDESVRRIKGEGRPILPQQQRAELVAALSAVDYVTVFDEPTVGPLLESLRVDVHCKGTDYTEQSVPERADAQAVGTETRIVGDPKDHSTQDLLQTVLERFAP